ncbi:MAG: flagellar basal body-associated FliL family protein [Bdellovibrionaceae bacterium]|jgi:flagellar FliL protein|nr:flagellar basal body-associated FliL family protein [Pseudobdellovibrionaceae bacterium]
MAEDNAQAAGASKSKLPIFAFLLAAINTVAIALVAFMVYQGRQKEKQTPGVDDLVRGEIETQKKELELQSNKERVFYPLKDFVVNLAGARGRRILKATIEFELPSQDAKKEVEAKEAQLRDQVILILSSKTYDEVAQAQGKEQLRQEIKNAVNPTLSDENKIVNVYFTDFIYN